MKLTSLNEWRPQDAIYLTWQLLLERPASANISHKATTKAEHELFFTGNPYREWLVIETNEGVVGTITLSNQNEIGIAILQAYQCRGYAEAAIRMVLEQYLPLPAINAVRRGSFIANVSLLNEASISLFGKLGAKPIQITYEL